jgi:hypothetical protein
MMKVLLSLGMAVVIGAVAAHNLMGDGILDFTGKGKAQRIVDEQSDIQAAMDAYASEYGDGEVDFGDVSEGESIFMYLRDKELLKGWVGDPERTGISEYRLSEDEKTIEGVVSDGKTCKNINNIKHGRPKSEPNPSCSSEDSASFSCCVNE